MSSAKNYDFKKKEIAWSYWEDSSFDWYQNKAVDRKSMLIPWKIKVI